ncbi:MAG: lipopolysaccharide transport periplasmic protein LptA [Sulfurimonas sp. RIFCSPHIGHO2_12_FULL_36_9]|uniref:lipopolysaccharide transport periplasmic protein LptA n=1 Tax=Sulfurimonas sp. RIFCSPLOWO2_12_36_12 TaxID=1802253 RepID=UPI0008BC1A2C|nr:lipopolysaccharide transport periplasmic protein LptA [Sulfurimonas sp. RIFCSPLOWO2_12_36_12]OHD97920.1 MAG: lipopolysaccharide transport periplasmic protein LptA [Sulfurimonas sp. RIFCSPHIGHO2_12_FULL_36_9]OHE00844.1 MAG: lipopolysaccharide transport periplasmic protein LptA [Sulfurimonas sp. RIFCSPLOWO2_02_FULL_36_28]OHE01842.1 MAG: lipopolysaccharide transport periplasmic protein LptA [Sulfurimonas sp. RIFCSPLOWO2_12_36_12]OHE07823.1 MAG: lipopolysaccharide transport periplasmic protein L
MKQRIFLTIFLAATLFSQDLQVKAKLFNADQKAGISVFEGNVNIIRGSDELNASKVTIYTNSKQEPTKFIAEGDASFNIQTLEGAVYTGKAQKVVYLPQEKEYHFFKEVHLKQINEKKEIIGEEVVLKTIEGKAYAKGAEKEPVIMIFNMPEDKKSENKKKDKND